MKTLEFFYDLSSPYSYLAATQLDGIAARTGATVIWKPMVLGAVFKAAGNSMPAAIPAKGVWMLSDLHRWARHYGVPFQFSSRFPLNALAAMRLCLVAEREGKGAAMALAAFRALWVEDRDLTEEAELTRLAAEVGLATDNVMLATAQREIKDQLRANTDEAVARGVFGAPAMFVGDALFWGNDRLHFVEDALREAGGASPVAQAS